MCTAGKTEKRKKIVGGLFLHCRRWRTYFMNNNPDGVRAGNPAAAAGTAKTTAMIIFYRRRRDGADRCERAGRRRPAPAEAAAGARRGPTAHGTAALVRARPKTRTCSARRRAADAYAPCVPRLRAAAVRPSGSRSFGSRHRAFPPVREKRARNPAQHCTRVPIIIRIIFILFNNNGPIVFSPGNTSGFSFNGNELPILPLHNNEAIHA